MAQTKSHVQHFKNLADNMDEVKRLLEIHSEISGKSPGYKHNMSVINKSGVVLLVACWEAYIEDLAQNSFEFMLSKSRNHQTFPKIVLSSASKKLKTSENNNDVWKLAGTGWKDVLNEHKNELFAQYIGRLNTPKPAQINHLYKSLLGINSLSSKWYWSGMSAAKSADKLNKLIELRGSIAHRVSTSKNVRKETVYKNIRFINLLAVKSSNAAREHIKNSVGRYEHPPIKWTPKFNKLDEVQHATLFDLYRLKDGKIVEHWETTEVIPPRSEWNNNNGKP